MADTIPTEIEETDLDGVSGGINPQPLPPDHVEGGGMHAQ
jgi:hypothetical protein